MAKDPAFLFYSADFLIGTSFMSDAEVGMYIRLICFQHQKGHLSESELTKVCGGFNEQVFSKFTKDGSGLYYNERTETEIGKRKSYSESRANNRKKDMNNISDSHDKDMVNENAIKNKDTIEVRKEKAEEVLVLSLPHGSDSFSNAWIDLCQEKKWRNKSQRALQQSLNILAKYPESVATDMINKCIAGGWQGLVEPKQNNFNNNGTSKKPASSSEALQAMVNGTSDSTDRS